MWWSYTNFQLKILIFSISSEDSKKNFFFLTFLCEILRKLCSTNHATIPLVLKILRKFSLVIGKLSSAVWFDVCMALCRILSCELNSIIWLSNLWKGMAGKKFLQYIKYISRSTTLFCYNEKPVDSWSFFLVKICALYK